MDKKPCKINEHQFKFDVAIMNLVCKHCSMTLPYLPIQDREKQIKEQEREWYIKELES